MKYHFREELLTHFSRMRVTGSQRLQFCTKPKTADHWSRP